MPYLELSTPVGVIGAGTMGAGIAQVAAQAGYPVILYDLAEGAAAKAKAKLQNALNALAARGKLSQIQADAAVARITPAQAIGDLSLCGLVIEAVVERLDVKQDLFRQLEQLLAPTAILASNTSSISVTAIAAGMRHPERVVGMHFFNPAPVMKLVEVVSGLATSKAVAQGIIELATAWGKIAVPTRSTPGFIVNRVARAYYAEALRLCEEGVADPVTLDTLMTKGAGFRMGPFALMDLIGHDVNYAVSCSVFDAYYHEPRFRPSALQLELVNAGFLGQKSGRGFYDYTEGAKRPAPCLEGVDDAARPLEWKPDDAPRTIEGVFITPSDGRRAAHLAGVHRGGVIVHDVLTQNGADPVLGFAASIEVTPDYVARFVKTLAMQGIRAVSLPDWPALVGLRSLALLANEGYEAVLQNVSTEEGVDLAMRYGVNYPKGPIAWAKEIGLTRILTVLDSLHRLTGDPRYRASLALRLAADPAA